MKKEIRKFMLSFLFLGCAMFIFSATEASAQDWVAPAKYKTMKNAKKGAADSDGVGKSLYKRHCAACHGNSGAGDGKKADMLDAELRELGSSAVQKQTDGELYYKSFIGRDEMPNFEKKIPNVGERWLIINYIRKMK